MPVLIQIQTTIKYVKIFLIPILKFSTRVYVAKTKLIKIRCAFTMFYFYDIIVLIETWMSPDTEDAELFFFLAFKYIN